MGMQMFVHELTVPVHVPVDEVCGHQEFPIIHYRSAVTVRFNRVIFTHDNRTGADFFNNSQVMGSGDDRLSGFGKCLDQIYEPRLAAGIEPSGRFVEQENIGIRGEDRCDADLLLYQASR